MGCLNDKYPDRCTSFLLAKIYKPTLVLRWKIKLYILINRYQIELLRIDMHLILNIEFLLFSSQIQFLNVVDGFLDSILSSFVISNFNPSIVLVIVSIFSDISVCLSVIQIHLKKSNEDFTIGSSWL